MERRAPGCRAGSASLPPEASLAQALLKFAAAGAAVWLDDLSRPRIQSGSLARMVEQGDIVGITTNPTIFAKAIGAGWGYGGATA